ncbi:MAG: iron-sulfur cluster assembly scaffold protein [Deltaproteobacteria bacterium]
MGMDREELMTIIMDHYESPRNYGALEDADVAQKGGNPGCGDIITIYLRVDSEGKITAANFDGQGCIVSQAATSMITELITGKTIAEVEEMTPDVITELLGKELPLSRPRCASLGLGTAKLAARELRRKQMINGS